MADVVAKLDDSGLVYEVKMQGEDGETITLDVRGSMDPVSSLLSELEDADYLTVRWQSGEEEEVGEHKLDRVLEMLSRLSVRVTALENSSQNNPSRFVVPSDMLRRSNDE